MIKSKRKTLVYSGRQTKALHKLESNHCWDYIGESKALGTKYSSSNYTVTKSKYPVNKGFKQGKELVDV